VFSDKSACSNPNMFEEFESNQSLKGEYLSEFSIGAKNDNKWKDLFANKKFEEIKRFIEILPVNSTDETIQNL
mgnify:CR=1